MFMRIQHISFMVMLLFSILPASAQVAMPDTVCLGTSRVYHVNDATVRSTYTWMINGAVQSSATNQISITWTTPGLYTLSVQEHALNGCDGDIVSGQIYVVPTPVAHAGPDLVVCYGNNVRLNGSGGAGFHWLPASYLSNPRISNPVVSLPAPGIYQYILQVSTNGCPSLTNDTVSVTMLPPVSVFAGNDTNVVINQPLQLNAVDVRNSGFTSYSWSPGFGLNNATVQNPVALLTDGITYRVTARTADGCEASDDIRIQVFKQADIYVPTAFTPNKDGRNDVLHVIPVGMRELKNFTVYNRWGQIVFTTSNPAIGWNGQFNGVDQDSNVFVWSATGTDLSGKPVFKKGTVTLIR